MKFHEYPKALRGPNGEIEIAPNTTAEKALRAAGYEIQRQPAKSFARAQNHINHNFSPMTNGQNTSTAKSCTIRKRPPAAPPGSPPKYVAGQVMESPEDEVALLAKGDAPPSRRFGGRPRGRSYGEDAGLGSNPQVTRGYDHSGGDAGPKRRNAQAYPMAMHGPDGGVVERALPNRRTGAARGL